VYLSRDGGKLFSSSLTPAIVRSSATVSPSLHAVATDSGVFVERAAGGYRNLTPRDGRSISDLRAVPGRALFGRTEDSIDSLWLKEGLPLSEDTPEVSIPIVEPPALEPSRLSGATSIRLPEGGRTNARYEVSIPGGPSPLDVFILFDSSGSMGDVIAGVRRAMADVVQQVAERGINAHYGVGRYVSYEDPPAYQRVLDIGPPDQRLARALEDIPADGGGDESQLGALYQVATGAGDEQAARNGYAFIRPGRQANFRAGALKTIIHLTDEPFSEGPPNPSYAETIDELAAKDIQQVGVALQELPEDVARTTPRYGLERVATGTGALAAVPLDCDGDGIPEVQPGDPIVCGIVPARAGDAAVMGRAILDMLDSLEDIGDVRLRSSNPAATITTEAYTGVDLSEPDRFGFTVDYTCPLARDDRTVEIRLEALLRGRVAAALPVRLACEDRTRPKAGERGPGAAAIALPVSPVIAAGPPSGPPPPPPAPVTHAQTNAQSQAQAQTQINPQGGFAHQEQHRTQVAVAHASAMEEKGSPGYAMSSYRRHRPSPVPLYLAAVFVLGVAHVLATRTDLQPRRNR
jgi:hypothetical protein